MAVGGCVLCVLVFGLVLPSLLFPLPFFFVCCCVCCGWGSAVVHVMNSGGLLRCGTVIRFVSSVYSLCLLS
nr:MAG TPA: Prominin [Caudoviricetes sp.]